MQAWPKPNDITYFVRNTLMNIMLVQLGAIDTFSETPLSIKIKNATLLSIVETITPLILWRRYAEYRHTECRVCVLLCWVSLCRISLHRVDCFQIVVLSVVMLSAVRLRDIILSAVMLIVIGSAFTTNFWRRGQEPLGWSLKYYTTIEKIYRNIKIAVKLTAPKAILYKLQVFLY